MKNKIKSVLIMICFTAAFFLSGQPASAQNNSFDLLVLPHSSALQDFDKVGLIAGDAIGRSPNIALTDAQLETIRAMDSVSIAAPYSVLGYFIPRSGGLIFTGFERDKATRLTLDTRYNGSLVDSREALFMADENQVWQILQGAETVITAQDPEGEAIALIQPFPLSWSLLVGVDPDAESALVGLDESVPRNNADVYFTDDPLSCDPGKTCAIPALFNRAVYDKLTVSARIETIDPIEGADAEALRAAFSESQHVSLIETEVNAGSLIPPHSFDNLKLDAAGAWSVETLSGLQAPAYTETLLAPVYLRYATFVPESWKSLEIPAKMHGSFSGSADPDSERVQAAIAELPMELNAPQITGLTYNLGSRLLIPQAPPPFTLSRIGSFDAARLTVPLDSQSETLLGLYRDKSGDLVYDEQQNPVTEEMTISANLYPTSYFSTQVMALTTLDAAGYLRQSERYIDGIRVKLNLTDVAEADRAEVIAHAADEIRQQTGLIVLNLSSEQDEKLVFVLGEGFLKMNWVAPDH